MLNECRCKVYKRFANETPTRCMPLICIHVYGIVAVSPFLIFACTCSISLFSFKICLLSAFILCSIRMLENLYKRLTITTNALLLIRMACNCLRICCKYAFLTEFRNLFLNLISQYLLNGPNAYEYERMSGDELANIVICKRIGAITVSQPFLGCFWSKSFDTCR